MMNETSYSGAPVSIMLNQTGYSGAPVSIMLNQTGYSGTPVSGRPKFWYWYPVIKEILILRELSVRILVQ